MIPVLDFLYGCVMVWLAWWVVFYPSSLNTSSFLLLPLFDSLLLPSFSSAYHILPSQPSPFPPSHLKIPTKQNHTATNTMGDALFLSPKLSFPHLYSLSPSTVPSWHQILFLLFCLLPAFALAVLGIYMLWCWVERRKMKRRDGRRKKDLCDEGEV